MTHHKNTPEVAARYWLLDNVMCQTDTLTHVLLDDTVHLEEPFTSSWHIFDLINRIQLSVPVCAEIPTWLQQDWHHLSVESGKEQNTG